MKCNSQYFCQHVIPDIQQHICSSSRNKTLKDVLLHLDNARAHDSRLSPETIKFPKAKRAAHPRYGPDLVPSDFFLFGYLKEKHDGTSFTPRGDLIFAIRQILSEMPEMELKNVFTNCVTKLSWVTKKGGEYRTSICSSQKSFHSFWSSVISVLLPDGMLFSRGLSCSRPTVAVPAIAIDCFLQPASTPLLSTSRILICTLLKKT
jgi:hypothetical protein